MRILVVENHSDTRAGIYKFLSILGYHVTSSESSAETLDIAAKNTFDVLLSDLSLPDGTGWDLLENLTDRGHRPLHAIAMSGLGASEDRSRSKAAGFMLHLVKPFRPEKLEEVLRHIAAGAEVKAQGEKEAPASASGDLRQKLHDGLCQQLAGGALLQAALVQRLEDLGKPGLAASRKPEKGVRTREQVLRADLQAISAEAKKVEELFHGALEEVRELMRMLP